MVPDWSLGRTWIIVSVPTGAMVVASKEYIPSVASNAERRGLRVHGRIMFKLMSHCSVILHHFAMRKKGGAPALIAVKWFFHVQHFLAILVRWVPASVY